CDVAVAMLGDIGFDEERMRAAVEEPLGFMLATEAADFLVRKGVPFRAAHEAVGGLVRVAESEGVGLEKLPLKAFRAAHARFDAGVYDVLTADGALRARKVVGGPSPANVRRQVARWSKRLEA
ncbi:MAG: argininosuccinate lyase, partial [Planctomycetota bacterium]|nr:argininosuccinate lyase [Planctomycetota bacterium]